MHITLITFGGRGEIYPFVALGEGLQAAGHDVRLVTHAQFETFVRDRGLGFFPAASNPIEILANAEGQRWSDYGDKPLLLFYRLYRLGAPFLEQAMIDCWDACQGTEAIVFSPLAVGTAYSIAEKLRIPCAVAAVYPLTPTCTFASPFFPAAPAWLPFDGGLYNRLTHHMSVSLFWQLVRLTVNNARKKVLSLPPLTSVSILSHLRQRRVPFLYGYSPSLLPPPPDWGNLNYVTGYWFLNRQVDWQPPAELVDFLASGSPPVCIGFSSLKYRRPEVVTDMLVKALVLSKQRGILLAGWFGKSIGALPEEVFMIDAVPHDWLFPQTIAVVHHGGSGTTGAALHARVPSIVLPFINDQPFWGQLVFESGVGPKPIPGKQISEGQLAAVISATISDRNMSLRAAALGERIIAEKGVARAVEVLEQYLGKRARK